MEQGQTAQLRVVGTGDALSYQWRKDGVDVAVAPNAIYQLGAVRPEQAGHGGGQQYGGQRNECTGSGVNGEFSDIPSFGGR